MNQKNKVPLIILAVVVIICLTFLLMIYQPGAGIYVTAKEINNPPQNYVKISLFDLDTYPYIKEAVLNPEEGIRIPYDEETTLHFARLLSENQTNTIEVNGTYYMIDILSAD